jgi:flagellar basal-body rod protein FlgB
VFENVEILNLAEGRARHAASRQAVVASNIANSDTPGYRAQDVSSFDEAYRGASARNAGMRATRPGHIQDVSPMTSTVTMDVGGEASPNGNTVSLEQEMVRSVEAQRDHTRSVTVYQSALTVLRTSVGRGR